MYILFPYQFITISFSPTFVRILCFALALWLASCGADEPITTPLPSPTVFPTATSKPQPIATSTATPVVNLSPLPTPAPTLAALKRYTFQIVNTFPHDTGAWTEGLLYRDNFLYEGTGELGKSSLRKVELATGTVLQKVDLPNALYGEGIVIFNEQVYQITWQNHIGYIRNLTTFAIEQEFTYPTEGWGMTHDGQKIIMSDGSNTLYFWDAIPKEIGRIQVMMAGEPVRNLNELEYINSEIYANVWLTDLIVRIDPNSGQVIGVIDLTGLLTPAEQATADVLNGIAYDDVNDRLFVTGKYWPKLFEIKLVELSQ